MKMMAMAKTSKYPRWTAPVPLNMMRWSPPSSETDFQAVENSQSTDTTAFLSSDDEDEDDWDERGVGAGLGMVDEFGDISDFGDIGGPTDEEPRTQELDFHFLEPVAALDRTARIPEVNEKTLQMLLVFRFLQESKCSEHVYEKYFVTNRFLYSPSLPKSIKTMRRRIEEIVRPLIQFRYTTLDVFGIKSKTVVRQETVAHISPVDWIRFWMANKNLSRRIIDISGRYTSLFLRDIEKQLSIRLGDMDANHHTHRSPEEALEWLHVLVRTKKYWKPRMSKTYESRFLLRLALNLPI
jgi:hypothetical protein